MNKLAQNLTEIEKAAGLSYSMIEPGQLINDLFPYIYGVAGVILLINIITSGLKLMTSQGDPKSISSTQAKLTSSMIGILILFSSYWIVKLVMRFLGITYERTLF